MGIGQLNNIAGLNSFGNLNTLGLNNQLGLLNNNYLNALALQNLNLLTQ